MSVQLIKSVKEKHQLDVFDTNFLLNADKLTDRRVRTRSAQDYRSEGWYNIVYRLSLLLCTDKSSKYKPTEIFKLVRESQGNIKSDMGMNKIELIFFGLFSDFPIYQALFLDQDDFNTMSFSKSMDQVLGLAKPNAPLGLEITKKRPENTSELMLLISEQLLKQGHYIETLGLKVLDLIVNDENNSLKDDIFKSFELMFQEPDNFDLHQEWFYSIARKSNVSESGDLDMAYYYWVNNSDIAGEILAHYKEQ